MAFRHSTMRWRCLPVPLALSIHRGRVKIKCNKVLLRQISGFVLHGVLIDPHHEFFVRTVDVPAPAHV